MCKYETGTIILNVPEPHALNILRFDLEKAIVISSHKDIKISPSFVRYFDCMTVLCSKPDFLFSRSRGKHGGTDIV